MTMTDTVECQAIETLDTYGWVRVCTEMEVPQRRPEVEPGGVWGAKPPQKVNKILFILLNISSIFKF